MKNKKMLISIILSLSFFVAFLLIDLLTKGLIIPNLIPTVGDRVGVIPKFISFVYVQNHGAAWGIFGNSTIFLIIFSIIVLSIFILFYVLRLKKVKNNSSYLLGISVGLIAGGSIGNLIDRIAFGYVRDFINFEFMNFPVFNVADIALTFGVIIMVIYFIFFYTKEDKNQNVDENIDKIEEKLEIFDENTSKKEDLDSEDNNER